MITDKKGLILKTISLFLLVMLLLITFCSCDKKTDGGKYDGIFSPKEETPWNEEHEYDTYVVVVPTDAS